MENKLCIKTDVLDIRKLRQEAYGDYDHIQITADLVLANPETREIFNRLPVELSCDSVLDVGQGDFRIKTVNGTAELKSTDEIDGLFYYIVNGKLDIGAGTQNLLRSCVGMQVNGVVSYPESLSGSLGMLTVNGTTVCYPDDAIVLKNDARIDRLFALRAKERLYWSRKRMIMVDAGLEPEVLKARGARFCAQEVILAQSLVDGMIDLIDDRTDIVVVADGTAVVTDDVTLDDILVGRHGSKLYIIGDVEVTTDSAAALEQVEQLTVLGDARVCASLKDAFLRKARVTGEVSIAKGITLNAQVETAVDRAMLEREPAGVELINCVNVTLAADIPAELILERLSLRGCVHINCSPEQKGAVSVVSLNCVHIDDGSEDDEAENEPEQTDGNVRTIKADCYVM